MTGTFWFDASPLLRDGLSKLKPTTSSRLLATFAEANGMTMGKDDGALPSLVLGDRAESSGLVVTRGRPRVEFANYGARFMFGTDDFVPSRQGCIAVQHNLDLPHVLVNFKNAMGAKTALNLTSATLRFLGSFSEVVSEPEKSEFSYFRREGVRITAESEVGVFAAVADESRARELITSTVLPTLTDLASSFTVEIRAGWMLAYSFYGDVSTTDPEVWAWVFSVASRMIDLTQVWRSGWPPFEVSEGIDPLDVREIPFYTPTSVPRPQKLDGIFSRSSLERLKR